MPRFVGLSITVTLASIFCSTSAMNGLALPGVLLPFVLAATVVVLAVVFRKLDFSAINGKLTPAEYALLAYAAAIGVVRLIPYTLQYVDHSLAGAVNYDDHFHFQELASLVNTERFPPRLNFNPESYLHFYYLPWIPAAALSDILKLVTGQSFLKLTYGLDALVLDLSATFIFIAFARHVLDERARNLAILAALLAGAVVEGMFEITDLVQGKLEHDEWWQTGLHMTNQFSMWTTLVVWVPHHLISAMALLLAVVVATEPLALNPRTSFAAQAAAGLLLGFALFSSIFAFIGGMLALAPLLLRFKRYPRSVLVLALALGLPSMPLLYIYLHSNSANGFVLFQAFDNWTEHSGIFVAGFVGIAIALLLMLMEVGWLFYVPFRLDRASLTRSPLGPLAITSFLFLLSTAVISFKGANNYAMRGSIAPVSILCCYFAQFVTGRIVPASSDSGVAPWPRWANVALLAAIILAGIGQFNQFALHCWSSWSAVAFAEETDACKKYILAVNEKAVPQIEMAKLASCRYQGGVYNIERSFEKRPLSHDDEELTGRGP